MRFLGLDRAFCLSPHPDDVEYAMSGTIARCSDTHFAVCLMSLGNKGDPTSRPNRLDESTAFWNDMPNVRFQDRIEWPTEWVMEAWIDALSSREYEAIFVPGAEDSHQDHRFTHALGRSLARNKTMGMISYAAPSTLNEWVPNLFSSVNLDGKIERLKRFYSQNGKPYFTEEALTAFHSTPQAAKKGATPVERFRIEEMYL